MQRMVWMFLLAAAAAAQPVTITGTLTGPGGDRLRGKCGFTASDTFRASDGFQVTPETETTVAFTLGALVVSLEPTTTGFPSTASYQVRCTAPPQVVTGADGKPHTSQGDWGPWTLVVEPTSSTLRDVLRYSRPPTTLLTYEAAVSGATTTVLATTHRLGTSPWVTGCIASGGSGFEPTVAIDVDGNLTITGTSAMSGTCRLAGAGADWVYVAAMSGRSVTIYATTHHLVRPMLGGCYDSGGAGYEPGGYTVSPASDDVTITAASSAPEFSGNCILQ